MLKRITIITLLALTAIGLSSQVSASLILEQYDSGTATPTTLGGYSMTDFAITNGVGGTATSINSPLSGSLEFIDRNDNSVSMERLLADSESWWVNGETNDYDIFTTNLHLITILLPENTRAFSFNVGADLGSTSNNAWLTATEADGSGINSEYWFNVNRTNTPGFGIYTNDTSCSAITSVTIDPLIWGFGNFSINQDSCSTQVPEPAPIALLALGLIGLGMIRRKVNAQ